MKARVRIAMAGLVLAASGLLVLISWLAPSMLPDPARFEDGDVLVHVAGTDYGVVELESFLRGEAWFYNAEDARVYVDRFVDHLLLQRVAEEMSEEMGRRVSPDLALQILLDRLPELSPESVSEDEVRRWYESNREQYHHPKRVTVDLLRLAVDVNEPSRAAHSFYIRLQMQNNARQFSDAFRKAATDSAERVTQTLWCGRFDPDVPQPVMEAACALDASKLIPPAEVGGIWYVGRVRSVEAARQTSMVDLATSIRRRIAEDRRATARDEILNGLRTRFGARVHQDRLVSLVDDGPRVPQRDVLRVPGGPG